MRNEAHAVWLLAAEAYAQAETDAGQSRLQAEALQHEVGQLQQKLEHSEAVATKSRAVATEAQGSSSCWAAG